MFPHWKSYSIYSKIAKVSRSQTKSYPCENPDAFHKSWHFIQQKGSMCSQRYRAFKFWTFHRRLSTPKIGHLSLGYSCPKYSKTWLFGGRMLCQQCFQFQTSIVLFWDQALWSAHDVPVRRCAPHALAIEQGPVRCSVQSMCGKPWWHTKYFLACLKKRNDLTNTSVRSFKVCMPSKFPSKHLNV